MFKNSFSFEGRIRRTEYGISFIIYVTVITVLNGITATVCMDASARGSLPDAGSILGLLIFYIPLVWFFFAQGAKRCHDVGNSGWWILIPFYLFWILFQKGQPGINKYGSNPKETTVNTNGLAGEVPIETGEAYSGGYFGGHHTGSSQGSTGTRENDA
jgi:uncharacterized membrane protein YhaH (DUF805 family)